MVVYHGRKGRLYASTSGTGTAVPVASLTNWTLASNTDRAETTSFGDANKNYVQGLADLQGTFAGFWNDSDTTLRVAAASTDGCKLYLYPSLDAPSKFASGPAWVDISYDIGVGDAAKISGSFAANGAWSNALKWIDPTIMAPEAAYGTRAHVSRRRSALTDGWLRP